MSPLPAEGTNGPKFSLSALTWNNRRAIVLVAGNQSTGSAFVTADDFTLSPLGANINVKGSWKIRGQVGAIPPNNLVAWEHRTQQGRDQHVKIVFAGYLFPLGHRATLTIITDRVLSPDPVHPGQYAGAYLQQHAFITVTQPTKSYPAPGQPYGNGAWPFSAATILTKITPDLEAPGSSFTPPFIAPITSQDYPQAFFPLLLDGSSFSFNVHLIDLAGTIVNMHVPLVFFFAAGVGYNINQYQASDPNLQSIISTYNSLGQQLPPADLVTSSISGTHVRFAPEVINAGKIKSGSTTHPTLSLTLGAASVTQIPVVTPGPPLNPDQTVAPFPTPISITSLTSQDQPAFYPTLLTANIRLHAAETLSRSKFGDGSGPGGVGIYLFGKYVTDGFTKGASSAAVHSHTSPVDPTGSTNPGSVYAGLLNTPALKFPADMVGGLSNPNTAVQGLSAAAGAVGGVLSDYATNAAADVKKYFGDLLNSEFLGGLKLTDILGQFLGDTNAPEITRQLADDGTVTVTYTLLVTLEKGPAGSDVFKPAGSPGHFTLTATLKVKPTGTTTYDVRGVVDGFTITILGGTPIIEIPFGDATTPGAIFTAASGKKADIKVNVGQPSFLGALDFVNSLEDFLKDIGGSGISINVGPTQISASVTLSLPSIGCGVFNLENLSLSAKVVVPFLGGATIATFGFCSQEQPFSLTVMCFGGGGYLLVSVGLYSLESLTASFDFEGQLALDFGVASGGVSAMAGITFSYVKATGSTLTGFVRITGELEVMGIISVTLELSLSLSYNFTSNQATGTATMKISVSLCFFSISVPITIQKTFNGPPSTAPHLAHEGSHVSHPSDQFINSSNLTFADQMDATAWAQYCAAFAA